MDGIWRRLRCLSVWEAGDRRRELMSVVEADIKSDKSEPLKMNHGVGKILLLKMIFKKSLSLSSVFGLYQILRGIAAS